MAQRREAALKTIVDGRSAFTVSLDGRWAVYAAYDVIGSNLMLAENFHLEP